MAKDMTTLRAQFNADRIALERLLLAINPIVPNAGRYFGSAETERARDLIRAEMVRDVLSLADKMAASARELEKGEAESPETYREKYRALVEKCRTWHCPVCRAETCWCGVHISDATSVAASVAAAERGTP